QAVMHRQIFPPGAMNSEVPAELDDLVMRALARDPGARISNAGELRDRLYSVLGGYGTTMSPARMGRWIRERFPDEWRAAQKLEQRVTLQARAGEATARPSSHLSVSASISTPGDLLDTTQVTTHPSVSSTSVSGSDSISPLGDVAAGGGSNLMLYMAAAVAATVSILAVLALAYFLGRTAG
ncbi:MAG: hypothetical protein KC933_25515, partial [Myxococcales bacterium]|nr:hypothetical protein [Myxococcales bacterium]